MEAQPRFVAVRTTFGQEYTVALMIERRVTANNLPIFSIVVAEGMRGVVVLEAPAPFIATRVVAGLKHAKGVVRGVMSFRDLEKFVAPKPVIEAIQVNDIVEVAGGPFIGMRGRVIQVDKSRGEVKIELSEAAYPLPITINAELVKIVKKAEESD